MLINYGCQTCHALPRSPSMPHCTASFSQFLPSFSVCSWLSCRHAATAISTTPINVFHIALVVWGNQCQCFMLFMVFFFLFNTQIYQIEWVKHLICAQCLRWAMLWTCLAVNTCFKRILSWKAGNERSSMDITLVWTMKKSNCARTNSIESIP